MLRETTPAIGRREGRVDDLFAKRPLQKTKIQPAVQVNARRRTDSQIGKQHGQNCKTALTAPLPPSPHALSRTGDGDAAASDARPRRHGPPRTDRRHGEVRRRRLSLLTGRRLPERHIGGGIAAAVPLLPPPRPCAPTDAPATKNRRRPCWRWRLREELQWLSTTATTTRLQHFSLPSSSPSPSRWSSRWRCDQRELRPPSMTAPKTKPRTSTTDANCGLAAPRFVADLAQAVGRFQGPSAADLDAGLLAAALHVLEAEVCRLLADHSAPLAVVVVQSNPAALSLIVDGWVD